MAELVRAIVAMSVSGSVLAALLFALKPLIKDRLPKAAQYYLWLVVVAALLVPVSRIAALPALLSLPGAPEGSPLAMTASSLANRYVITSEEELGRVQDVASQYSAEEIAGDYQYYAQAIKQAQSPIAGMTTIFGAVYPFGFAAVLLYYALAYALFARKIWRRSTPAGIDCPVPVRRSAMVATPMLVGLFSPAIVLPDREYAGGQLRAVLLHELAHLRRKDVLVKWLSVLACAVHWFNPVAWLARREIDRACELSCDEAAIAGLDPRGRQSYGDTLLHVAADSKAPRSVLSTTMCEEKKDLKERLAAIMKSRKRTRAAAIASAAAILAAAMAAFALGAGSKGNGAGGAGGAAHTAHTISWDGQTERTYYLEGAADGLPAGRVASVTLFADGTIKIPTPPLSSYFFPPSRYLIDGDALLVYEDGDADDCSVRFKIVDADTLEVAANNLGVAHYMDAGARYAYAAAGGGSLAALKTPYVGDSAAVGKIIGELPPIGAGYRQRFFSIGDDYGTGRAPYTLTVYYEYAGGLPKDGPIGEPIALDSAALLFDLIENLQEVAIVVRDTPSGGELDKSAYAARAAYSRDSIREYLSGGAPTSPASDESDKSGELDKLDESDEANESGELDKLDKSNEANESNELNKSNESNESNELNKANELDEANESDKSGESHESDERLKKLYIGMPRSDVEPILGKPTGAGSGLDFEIYGDAATVYYGGNYYEDSYWDGGRSVVTQVNMGGRSWNLYGLVSAAVKQRGAIGAPAGAYLAESHANLALEANADGFAVYVMALCEAFLPDGEHGVKEVGGFHMPLALAFARNASGGYELAEYWQPEDGSGYLPSLRGKFPKETWDKLDTQVYIERQQQICREGAMDFFVGAAPRTASFGLGSGAAAAIVTNVADYAEEDGCFTVKCFPGAMLTVANIENSENTGNTGDTGNFENGKGESGKGRYSIVRRRSAEEGAGGKEDGRAERPDMPELLEMLDMPDMLEIPEPRGILEMLDVPEPFDMPVEGIAGIFDTGAGKFIMKFELYESLLK